MTNRIRGWRLLRVAPWLAVLLCEAQLGAAPTPRLMVKVEKVCLSPKIWSGVIDAKQCIEVTVMKPGGTAFTFGQGLHLDVQLIKGNRLFERDVPQLSASQIGVGSVISINTSASCFQRLGPTEYAVQPSCIVPVRNDSPKPAGKSK